LSLVTPQLFSDACGFGEFGELFKRRHGNSKMAASDVCWNCEGSHMVYVEETHNQSTEQTEKRIKPIREAQQARTSNDCYVSFLYL